MTGLSIPREREVALYYIGLKYMVRAATACCRAKFQEPWPPCLCVTSLASVSFCILFD